MYDRILKYAQVKVATTPEPKQKASCEHPHSSEHQPKQRPSTNQNKNE